MGKRFRAWKDRRDDVEQLIAAREAGATLRQAAAAGGVHISTACRWQAADPTLAAALRDAESVAWRRKHPLTLPYVPFRRRRPRVPVHPCCPQCGRGVRVRSGGFLKRFWRCAMWPLCPWSSWRPRHPEDCPRCGGPRFWSHSRLSVSCPKCGERTVRISTH